MASIEDRVVSLKFDNAQFQRAVSTTLGALSTLKNSLADKFRATGLSNIGKEASKVDLTPISSGIEKINDHFNNLKVVGLGALAALGAKASQVGIEMGKNFINNAFVKNPKAGFEEYELNIDSIQTIMANTGEKLPKVNKSLNELNTYADDTIYNFADMTRNIGLFTNAGIKLQDATDMIKGFSNEAAVSGTNATAASGAAYQLSQALSAGVITLMDWRSLSNVGMGNANMRKGIIEIADAMGAFKGTTVNAKDATEDFNGTLEKKWLSADVMQNYLKIQAGELSKAQMKNIGLTDQQIDRFVKQQGVAEDAARKIRTFSKLMGTIEEVSGSGWTQSWQYILGDFEEATKVFSALGDTIIDDFITPSAKARNEMLKTWKQMGGRQAIIDSVVNVYKALNSVLEPIKGAWSEVFGVKSGDAKGKMLANLSKAIAAFTKSLILSESMTKLIGQTFKLFFNIIKIGVTIVGGLITVLTAIFKGLFKAEEGASGFADGMSQILENVNNVLGNTEWITNFFKIVGELAGNAAGYLRKFAGVITQAFANSHLIRAFGDAFMWVATTIGNIASALGTGLGFLVNGGLEVVLTRVIDRLHSLHEFGESVARVLVRIKSELQPLIDAVSDMVHEVADNILSVFTETTFDQGLDMLNVGLLGALVVMVRGFFKNILGIGDGAKKGLLDQVGGIVENVTEALESVTSTLSAMQQNLKAGTLMKIAGAIAILTGSLILLSLVDSDKLTGALIAMGVMFTELGISMKLFDAAALTMNVPQMIQLGIALIAISIAINLLASAVKKLGSLDLITVAQGLTAVMILLKSLSKMAAVMAKNAANLISMGVGLMAAAIAISILAVAVRMFGTMDIGTLIQGLAAVGATLVGLGIFTKLTSTAKQAPVSAAALIGLAISVGILALAVRLMGSMDLASLAKGLIAITLTMKAMTTFVKNVNGAKGIAGTAFAMILLGSALTIMGAALRIIAALSWDELVRGLVGLSVGLQAMVVAMQALGKIKQNLFVGALAFTVVAAALHILAGALQAIGSMSWQEMGVALISLGVSMGVLAGAMFLMAGSVAGAAGLTAVAIALALFLPTLVMLSTLTWPALLIGLTGLAAAFAVIGVAGLLVAPIVPILVLFGAAVALLGAGLMGVGVGMLTFSLGLTALTAVGAATFPVLSLLVMEFLKLIPFAMEQLGAGIVAFTKVLLDNVPAFFEAAKVLISTVLDAIIELAPKIGETLLTLIETLLDLLWDAVPQFVTAAMALMIAILTGIGNKIGALVNAAINLVVNFLNAIASRIGDVVAAGVNILMAVVQGIANSIDQVIAQGFEIVINLIDSLTATINTQGPRLRESAKALGWAIVNGITGGLADKIGGLKDRVVGMASSALGWFKSKLGIASPSKEFRKASRWIPVGSADGVDRHSSVFQKSIESMGDKGLTSMKKSVAKLATVGMDGVDVQPRIRPVLDLTDVRNGAGLIPGLLGDQSLAGTASLQARGIADYKNKYELDVADAHQNGSVQGTTIKLEQNNYSPKALSTADIYRNTNNQISRAKELIGAK